jgi:hypothetical protein
MKSITRMADVTGEVLDTMRTTTTASLPLQLTDIVATVRNLCQLIDELVRLDGVQGRQLAKNPISLIMPLLGF